MMKTKMYEKVAELIKQKQGRVHVNDPDLDAVTAVQGKSTKYRLATYMWEIRTKMSLAVVPIRQGRSVIAYEVPAYQVKTVAEPVVDASVPAESITVSAPIEMTA